MDQRGKRTAALLAGLALLTMAAHLARGGGLPFGLGAGERNVGVRTEIQPAEQAPGSPVVVSVTLACPDRWYVYADSVRVELAPEGDARAPAQRVRLHLPSAKQKHDPFLDETVQYFSVVRPSKYCTVSTRSWTRRCNTSTGARR